MLPRILSIACPLFVYVTLAVLISGLWRERRKVEWPGLVLAAAGLLASFAALAPVHRLFFDEDIYISIAGNLTRTPVAQITLLGGPDDVQVSTYYKEPSGWPVLLSLIFLITGRSELGAVIVARILYAISIAAVYQVARAMLPTRRQAVVAAVIFAGAPACFWFSPSAGTDIPAALFAVLGIWGVVAGNGVLAAAGFALAAQTRLELIILLPLVWLSSRVSWNWKLGAAGMVAAEIVHLGWVMSIAPVLAEAEKVDSAFSLGYLGANLVTNLGYILNPTAFPSLMAALALFGLIRNIRRLKQDDGLLWLQAVALFGVYLVFYAGSFNINPRYTIQFLAPMAILAVSVSRHRVVLGILLLSAVIPYSAGLEHHAYVETLAADHNLAVKFASTVQPNDLVLSTEPEVFLNQDRRAMNAVFASEHRDRLEQELGQRKVLYHSGVRTNRPDTVEWRADQWVKSNFELHLIDSHEIQGTRIAFYEILLKSLDSETR